MNAMPARAARPLAPMITLFAALSLATAAFAGGDWNDAQISWRSYDDGVKEANKSGKPICLIFYTNWCPHCANYSKVFHDPKVVERAKQFVMIRINKDENQELSGKFAPDGQYIPRTYFLSSKGELEASIHAPRDQYKYFYDEKDSASILGGMEAALDKLGSKS